MSPVLTLAPAVNAFVLLIDKVISTYVQAFVGLLLIGDAIDVSTAQAAAIAAIPAALTVVANGMPITIVGLPFWIDLVYRVARTYVVGFVGLIVAVPVFRLDYAILQAAAYGAIPAALAVIKGALASRVGEKGTPAMVPARYDLPPAGHDAAVEVAA
jgi:hypothetical protein